MRKSHPAALGLLLFSLLAIGSHAASSAVGVPKGTAPVIDGVLDDAEWKDALSSPMTGGGRVLLKHDGRFLYLALQGAADGFAQVYFGDQGSVRVLHASAALGEITYRPFSSGKWETDSKYTFEMRRFAERSPEEKDAYLEKNDWLANSANRGAVREFKILRSAVAGKRLAIVYREMAGATRSWPASLHDDALHDQLVSGYTPGRLAFDLTQWAELAYRK